MSQTTIVFIFVFFIVIWFIFEYNRGIGLKNFKNEAFSTMDVYLKKRWDLIPNILEATRAFAEHEKTVFDDITKLRTQNYSGMSDDDKIETNNKLSLGISKLIAVAENYPDIKSSENFQQMSNELSKIESEIANARKYYNGCVRDLNNYLEYFPTNIIGNIFHFEKGKFFEIDEVQRENVKVKF